MARRNDAARRHHERMQIAAKDAAERESVRRFRLMLAGMVAASGLAAASLYAGDARPALAVTAMLTAGNIWSRRKAG